MKKYTKILIGSLLVALSFNLFLIPYNFIPSGLNGLSALFGKIYGTNPVLFLATTNLVLLTISYLVLGIQQTKKYLLTSLLFPLMILLTQNLNKIISFSNIEPIIIAITGAVLTGYGYSLIYQEDESIGGIEIIQAIINNSKIYQSKFLTYIVDFIIIILAILTYNFELAVYSAIIIIIINYIATKSKLGISSNKTFFIITTKENEVKNYLINDLRYDYTEFNVKGGFTNQKNKIIMTVIDTKDYYRLKEGISLIDKKAFISIIDNYESINKNISINKKIN